MNTENIDKFSTNLNQLSKNGKLNPITGHNCS